MMYDSLILVHLYPDMSISLSRNGPRLDKISSNLIVRMVASLRRGHILLWRYVLLLGPPSHRLVIELSALLLKLVVTYVESISPQAMIAHLSLDVIVSRALAKHWLLLKSVRCVIIVNIMRVVFGV